jgi:hypothetical protein
MFALTDSITVGIVLTLVFGAMFLYLFNRVAQVERRVDLTEIMLLDLKQATGNTLYSLGKQLYNTAEPSSTSVFTMNEEDNEVHHYTHRGEVPSSATEVLGEHTSANINESDVEELPNDDFYKNALNEAVSNAVVAQPQSVSNSSSSSSSSSVKMDVNYEALTLKELKQIAKDKNLNVPSSAHKKDVITLLKNNTSSDTQNMFPSADNFNAEMPVSN